MSDYHCFAERYTTSEMSWLIEKDVLAVVGYSVKGFGEDQVRGL